MTNKILTAFVTQILEDEFLFHDNPRQFILNFLDERGSYTSVWANAPEKDQLEAEAILNIWGASIPKRMPGELVYVLSYLNAAGKGPHLTLLGPTFFSHRDNLDGFIEAAAGLSEDTAPFTLKVGEELSFTGSQTGELLLVHSLVLSKELKQLHDGLRMLAQLHDGRLLEPHFADAGYLPHITHHKGCHLKEGDEIVISDMSFTLHPGARFHIERAKSLARVSFTR